MDAIGRRSPSDAARFGFAVVKHLVHLRRKPACRLPALVPLLPLRVPLKIASLEVFKWTFFLCVFFFFFYNPVARSSVSRTPFGTTYSAWTRASASRAFARWKSVITLFAGVADSFLRRAAWLTCLKSRPPSRPGTFPPTRYALQECDGFTVISRALRGLCARCALYCVNCTGQLKIKIFIQSEASWSDVTVTDAPLSVLLLNKLDICTLLVENNC